MATASANAELRATHAALNWQPYPETLSQARSHAEAALKASPDSRRGLYEMARVQWREGDLEGALSTLERSLKIERKPLPMFLQGVVLNALGRPEEALQVFEAAMNYGTTIPEMMVEKGHSRNLLGRHFDGLIAITQGMHTPNATVREAYAGESYVGLGKGEAVQHLSTALILFTDGGKLENVLRTYMAAGIAEKGLAKFNWTPQMVGAVSPISEGVALGILKPAHLKAIELSYK